MRCCEGDKKPQLLCQKDIHAVMSFHNCLRITNHGLGLLLDLCQRTLASIEVLVVFFNFPFFFVESWE